MHCLHVCVCVCDFNSQINVRFVLDQTLLCLLHSSRDNFFLPEYFARHKILMNNAHTTPPLSGYPVLELVLSINIDINIDIF